MKLNAALVHRRRRELGLTQRQLANDIGVTSSVITRLESGENHHAATVDFVARLAGALAVHPVHLFDFDEVDDLVDDVADVVAHVDLVAHLGVLLFEVGVLTPVAALADALKIDLVAVEKALSELEAVLAPAGLVLHRRAGDVAIQPNAARNTAAVKKLIRSHHARRGMKLSEARMLRRVADGGVDEGKLSNPDRVTLSRLRRAGLVEGDRYPRLTDEVASSLKPVA